MLLSDSKRRNLLSFSGRTDFDWSCHKRHFIILQKDFLMATVKTSPNLSDLAVHFPPL